MFLPGPGLLNCDYGDFFILVRVVLFVVSVGLCASVIFSDGIIWWQISQLHVWVVQHS